MVALADLAALVAVALAVAPAVTVVALAVAVLLPVVGTAEADGPHFVNVLCMHPYRQYRVARQKLLVQSQ